MVVGRKCIVFGDKSGIISIFGGVSEMLSRRMDSPHTQSVRISHPGVKLQQEF